MVVQKRILILVILLSRFQLFSQIVDTNLIYFIDTTILDFKIDPLGNFWFIYDNKYIVKRVNQIQDDTFLINPVFSKKTIDLKFPFKSMIYDKQNNTIQLINSRMGLLSELKLDKIGILDPKAVNFSTDENYWILDRNTNQIFKVNESGIPVLKAKNPFYFQDKSYYPQLIIDKYDYSLAIDTNFGFFIFNRYGSLIQSLKLEKSFHFISIINDDIYIKVADSIIHYKKLKFQNSSLNSIILKKSFPSREVLSIQYFSNHFFVLRKNGELLKLKNLENYFLNKD